MVRNATVKAAKTAKRKAEHAKTPKKSKGERKTENAKAVKAAANALEKKRRTEANHARRQANDERRATRVVIDL